LYFLIAPEKLFAVKPALPYAISKCAEFFVHRKELRIARHGAYLCVREYRATANSAAMGETSLASRRKNRLRLSQRFHLRFQNAPNFSFIAKN
jgi:hypothetical protein